MMWTPFCVIFMSSCFIHLVSTEPNKNLYANPNLLRNVARIISMTFKDVERTASDFQPASYFNKLGKAMEKTVNRLRLYDVPPIDPVNSIKTFGNNNPENQTHLISIINAVYDIMHEIDANYITNKISISLLKSLNNTNIKTNDVLQEILPIHEEFHINEALLDDFAMKIQWFQPHQCVDDVAVPRQYSVWMTALSFISSRLKAFFNFVVNQQHQYVAQNISLSEFNERIQLQLQNVETALTVHHPEIRHSIAVADRQIRSCGNKKLIRDVNFIELERVFQLTVIPEYGFEENYNCNGTCADMHGGTSVASTCYRGFCGFCEGVLSNCRNESYIHVCKLNAVQSRRYEWFNTEVITDENEKNARNCSGVHVEAAVSYDEENTNVCEYCICTCEENTEYSTMSTFIISSQFVESDVKQHMVVTGVRFVKEDNIIYTQIKQGQLMPGGHIRHDIPDQWKPISTLEKTEVTESLKKSRASKNITHEKFIVVSSDVKLIHLNDLACDSDDLVLTGVGLGLSKIEENTNRIVLFIGCHRVNFKNGELRERVGTGPREHPNPKSMTELIIGGLPPNRVQEEHYPDSTSNRFVEIKMSDRWEDGGQSVLPWFDAQNVIGTKSVALSGIGLYHKGAYKSGGFIAFRLWSIDFTRFIFPDDPYALSRSFYENRRPWIYCHNDIPETLCILCNGSYAERNRRGIIDDCCSARLCDAKYLKQYCGVPVDDNTDLRCLRSD